jgi:hypothetical protein
MKNEITTFPLFLPNVLAMRKSHPAPRKYAGVSSIPDPPRAIHHSRELPSTRETQIFIFQWQ